MSELNKIIIALSDKDLNLGLLCNAGDSVSDIYKLHKEFTGNLSMGLPYDEYYLMNNDGDIVFIGDLKSLSHFCNK